MVSGHCFGSKARGERSSIFFFRQKHQWGFICLQHFFLFCERSSQKPHEPEIWTRTNEDFSVQNIKIEFVRRVLGFTRSPAVIRCCNPVISYWLVTAWCGSYRFLKSLKNEGHDISSQTNNCQHFKILFTKPKTVLRRRK